MALSKDGFERGFDGFRKGSRQDPPPLCHPQLSTGQGSVLSGLLTMAKAKDQ